MSDEIPPKQKRGFAVLDPERQREIAAKGGAAVPRERRLWARDPKLAAAAGQIGGRWSKLTGSSKREPQV